jgi:hypothetical protein
MGFFTLLGLLFFMAIPEATKDILQVMLGAVATQWTAIIQYHFGSSSGSHRKTDMLNELTGAGDGNTKVTTNATITTEKVTKVEPSPEAAKEKVK